MYEKVTKPKEEKEELTSGIPFKEFLSNKFISYDYDAFDIMEGERTFSRDEIQIDISGYVTRRIRIKNPLVTSPMPDVTDVHIAITAARLGAVGVIPATPAPEEQAEMVRKVKTADGRFIENPFTLTPKQTLADALEKQFSNIPVIDKGKIVGMFLSTKYGDFFYSTNKNQPISSAMETNIDLIAVDIENVQENGLLNLERARSIMLARKLPAIAIINSRRELKYLITMKDVEKETLFPDATRDANGRLIVGAAILEYMTQKNLERVRLLADADVDFFVIDQAHGWNEDVKRMTQFLKKTYPHIDVVAGNDSVIEASIFHYKNGADAIRVGQGTGSICLTWEKEVVGIGRPQLSAVYDCAYGAYEIRKRENDLSRPFPCIADGGIEYVYDAFKALCAGAHSVMIGKLIAGTKDSPAREIESGVKLYRGMASPELAEEYKEAFHRYHKSTFIPEGRTQRLPVVSTFEVFLKRFSGLLKKEFERVGARNLEELHTKLRSGDLRAQYAFHRKQK